MDKGTFLNFNYFVKKVNCMHYIEMNEKKLHAHICVTSQTCLPLPDSVILLGP